METILIQRPGARRAAAPLPASRRNGVFGAILCAGAVLAGAGRVSAAEPTPGAGLVHVVAVPTRDDGPHARALTIALRTAVSRTRGWSLGEGEHALDVLVLQLRCPEVPDTACEQRIGDTIKADRYLWGTVEKRDDAIVGELHYWVRGQGTKSVPVSYSAGLDDPGGALATVATEAFAALTGAPKGKIHVKAGQVSGQVLIDGQPAGPLTNGAGSFAVAPGEHTITVRAPGFADAERTATIASEDIVDLLFEPAPAEESTSVTLRKVGGFIGASAGVLFLGLGVISSLQVNDAQQTLGTGPDNPGLRGDVGQGDLCSGEYTTKGGALMTTSKEAMDACGKGVFVPLQFVFFGLGFLGGGAGAYLLGSAYAAGAGQPKSAAAASGWTFDPVVSPRGGALSASYRF